jgi:hypothetical protein
MKKILFIAVEFFLLLLISVFLYRYICNFCLLLLKLFKAEYGPYRWFVLATMLLCVGLIYAIIKLPFLKNLYLKILLSYIVLFTSLCMLFIIWYFTFVPVG